MRHRESPASSCLTSDTDRSRSRTEARPMKMQTSSGTETGTTRTPPPTPGLFLDSKLLLQEGVDSVNRVPIDTIQDLCDAWDMSRIGRYVLCEVMLADNFEAVLRLDLGPWERLGSALPGTTTPKLRAFGQLTPNSAATVRLTRGIPNGTTNLVFGLSQSSAHSSVARWCRRHLRSSSDSPWLATASSSSRRPFQPACPPVRGSSSRP